MASNFNFSLGFNVDRDGINIAKQEIANLKKEMQNNPMKFNLDVNGLQEAVRQVDVFENALKKAFNQDIGRLNTKEFLSELHKADSSLTELRNSFSQMGVDASSSIKQIESSVEKVGLSLRQTNKFVESMGETFANTLKWNVASGMIDRLYGSVDKAIGFTKALDESLNNIRIVTGKSNDEMGVFAQSANEAAKALGRSTTEYSDASLIFFQQGKTAREVKDLTKATLIASNVTGEDTAHAADLLTAALNGYNLEANKAMEITDKFAAVGAASGSDFNELAIGFSKVASMANVAGVNVDQLNGMLATVSTVTREAPESIGTSFKTIFGRMTDLKAGKKDEDGWVMGDVEKALKKVGMSAIDQNGKLRDTGELLTEIGDKWRSLNKESQMALSVAMAGNRQQNRLLALFSNWDMYKEQLKESQDAEGAALEQNLIRMDSISYKSKQLKATMEELWMKIIDSNVLSKITDFLTGAVGQVNSLVDAFGGIGPVLLMIGATMGRIFSNKTSNGITNFVNDLQAKRDIKNYDKGILGNSTTPEMAERNKQEYEIRKFLTQEEHKAYKQARETLEVEERKLKVLQDQHKQKVTELGGERSDLAKKAASNTAQIGLEQKAAQELELLKQKKIALQDISNETIKTIGFNDTALLTAREQFEISVKQENMEEQILQDRKARVATLEQENKILQKNQNILLRSEGRVKTQNQEVDEAGAAVKPTMNTLSDKASKVGNMQSIINGALAATFALTGVIGSLKEFSEAGEDATKKANALGGVLESIGSAMLMTGNLWGAAVIAVAEVGKWAWENSGIRKTAKTNKDLLLETAKAADEAKTKMKALNSVESDYNTLRTKMKGGTVSLDKLDSKNLATYYEMSNKIAESSPELVKYYDDQGNAILDLSKKFESLKEAQREQIRVQSEMKVGNAANFAAEYSDQIGDAQKTIAKKKEILNAIQGGDNKLASYNMINQTSYKKEDFSKIAAEIQVQQSKIQDASKNIHDNIVKPLFDSSKGYKLLSKDQQGIVNSLFNVEKATALAFNPGHLENYQNGVKRIIDVLGKESVIQDQIKKNKAEIELQKQQDPKGNEGAIKQLEEENKKLAEQSKLAKEAADKFTALGEVKQNFVANGLGNLGDMGLDPNEQEKAYNNLTDFYGKNDILKTGPMTRTDLESAAGVDTGVKSISDLSKEQSNMYGLQDQAQEYGAKASDANMAQYGAMEGMVGAAATGNIEAIKNEASALMEYDRISAEATATEEELVSQKEAAEQQSKNASMAIMEEKDANAVLEEQYWNQIGAMANTVEGYNQIADAYNRNLGLLDEFTGVMEGTIQTQDMSKEQMDQLAGALDQYSDTIPGLSDALEAYRQNGESSFGDLAQYMGQASEEMKQQNGRMYAAMMQNDGQYYQTFTQRNKQQTDQMFIEYGVRASNYSTYAEYENAIHQAMEKGKLNATDQAINRQMLLNEENVNNHADGMDIQKKNTANTATKNVSIWSVMTSSQMTISQKIIYVWKSIMDSVAGMANSAANTVIDIWNGMVSAIEGGISAVFGGINDLVSKLPEKAQEYIGGGLPSVNLSGFKAGHVSFSTSNASEYLASVATGYDAAPNFDYGAPSTKQGHTGTTGGSPDLGGSLPSSGNLGPNASSGGDDGSGKKKGKEGKTQEDMEVDLDPLHDTNVLLEQQDALLKQLKSDEEQLYGKAKQDNLTKQNEALARKKELLQQQLEIINQQAAAMKGTLGSKGVTFDANGTITNYNQIIQAKVNAANGIADADAKKAAQDDVKNFMDDLKKYEDFTIKTRFDKEQAIEEVEKLQHTLYMEQFEYVVTVKLDLVKDQTDYLKFLEDINKEFEEMSENYDANLKSLGYALADVATIQEHIKKINEDTSLTEKDRIEQLEKYEKLLEDSVKNAEKLKDDLIKINEEALKKGVDLLNEHLGKFEAINKQMDHYQNMAKLMGMQQAYGEIDKFYEVQEKALTGQLDAMQDVKSSLVKYRDGLKEGSKEWEYANEQVTKMDDQINKLVETTLKTFQEELKSSVDGILNTLDEKMSGGKGLDDASEKLKKLQKQQKEHLSTQEKIVWTGQMQSKIQEQINETSNPEAKAKLQQYLSTELKALKEKNNLSKYEVERAEKLYQITLQQIAVDESRANKTLMRLVRDSSGNWSYQYVEDSKKVQDAQQKLSDELEDLMEFDKKALMDNQEEMLQAKKDFQTKMQEILKAGLNGEYATQDEFNKAVNAAQTDFNATMEELDTAHQGIIQNNAESTTAAVLDTYATNTDGLGIYSADAEAIMKTLGEKIGTDWTKVGELIKITNTGNSSDFKTFTDKLGIDWNSATGIINNSHTPNALLFKNNFVNPLTTDINGVFSTFKGVYTGISSQWNNDVDKQITSNVKLKGDVNTAVNGIKNKWHEYQEKVKTVTDKNGQGFDSMKSQTDKLSGSVDKLNKKTNGVTSAIDKELTSVSSLVKAYQGLKDTYDDIIKKAVEYIGKLNESIQKQKEVATGVKTPTAPAAANKPKPTPTPAPKPKPTPAPAPKPAPAPTVPAQGSKIRVKSGRRWFYDSWGTNPSGPTDPYSNQDLMITSKINDPTRRYPYNVGRRAGEYLGWLRLQDIQGFRTGGYTGNWGGTDGKVAMLHQKELILNQADTRNILDAVQIVRDYSSMIKGAMGSLSAPGGMGGNIEQSVTINADFSGVKSSGEIEQAFANLANRASQFAKKR